MSDLVENPEDRFSQNEAQIIIVAIYFRALVFMDIHAAIHLIFCRLQDWTLKNHVHCQYGHFPGDLFSRTTLSRENRENKSLAKIN